MNYAVFRRKLIQKMNQNRPQWTIDDPHVIEGLSRDSICIDLGANVGVVTQKLRDLGCHVFSFEPHPGAVKQLQAKFGQDERVKIIPAAASDKNGITKLFFHAQSENDTDNHGILSESSSVVSAKVNVDTSHFVEVPEVDIAEFVSGLPRNVDFMKMDVEGHEVSLLWRLIHGQAIHKIKKIYVETHEEKVPWLYWRLLFLKIYLKLRGIHHINFDWT